MTERGTNTLFAALTATPFMFVISPGSSSWAEPSLGVTSIGWHFVSTRRYEKTTSDPDSLSVTIAKEEESLATINIPRVVEKWLLRETELAKLEKEFDQYSQLEPGWDDRSAIKPAPRTIRMARNLARWASDNGFTPSRTYPSPDGELGLVWEKGTGYADLSIGDDATVSFYIKDRTGTQELYSQARTPLEELPGEFWSLAATF
jgi:hypothetical protein